MTKQILCFYVGYMPDYTSTGTGVYGSELALKKISEFMTQHYDVHIFGPSFSAQSINGVAFANSSTLIEFVKDKVIDVMIVMRYIHYFLEFPIMAKRTFLWLHDVLLQPFWRGMELPQGGKHLLTNVIDKIDGVITLCEWHRAMIIQHLDINPGKIHIIGNGIDTSSFPPPSEKIKGRFIYVSSPSRGLMRLVSHFTQIREILPYAELYIYRGIEEFNVDTLMEISKYPYVKFMGKMPNHQLMTEMMKAEYWYYPTHFCETYCISALEAQMAGCICITTDLGALSSTVGNRGTLISEPIDSEAYLATALSAIKTSTMNEKAREWAREQTWENRASEWLKLITKD